MTLEPDAADSTEKPDPASPPKFSLRPRSLRARLALWHGALLALTLAGLAALTLWLLSGFLHSRADAALEDYADKTARTIAAGEYRASLGAPATGLLNKQLQEWGRQIQVVDSRTAAPIEWSDGLASKRLPVSLEARVRAERGQTTFETRRDLGERPVRICTVPVQKGNERPYFVQTAASLEGIEEALQRAGLILLFLTPAVFVVALLGGWFLVGRSLRTVDAITRTAMGIEAKRLDQRIAPPGADDEIARLASAFNEMIARLDQSFRQIQQFSADASHELRTPLTAIRGEAEVALMDPNITEDSRKTLRSIVDSAERMSAIVENLLLLARADARELELRREEIALHEVALSSYEQLEPLARRKGIALEIGNLDEATVKGDPLWLGQILTNLLNNAIKFTQEGGQVTLSLNVVDGEARLSVADTGQGIAPEHLPKLFDRFYRTDAGRSRDAGGVGLGLNIAQWAAQSHGGRIEVTSEVGKGSVFSLVLPLAS